MKNNGLEQSKIRTREIALHHMWMYDDCDCIHCEKYRLENNVQETLKKGGN